MSKRKIMSQDLENIGKEAVKIRVLQLAKQFQMQIQHLPYSKEAIGEALGNIDGLNAVSLAAAALQAQAEAVEVAS